MPPEDFAALCADIKANGLIQPIVLFESMVIDGWHRYQACVAAGIEPRSSLLPQGADPVTFVLACNLHRRHLTASQRALAIVTCSNWRPSGRPAGKDVPGTPFSKEQMAAKADVSESTIARAKVVASKAAPEVVEAVKAGKVSVKAAVKTTKPAKPNGKPAAKKTAAKAEPAPEEYSKTDMEIDNLRGALDAISEENDELKQRVAVECMDATEEDKLLAHDLITDLRRQVKQLTLELHATQSTRNSYMVENGELKKTVAYWRRRAEKAEKGVA